MKEKISVKGPAVALLRKKHPKLYRQKNLAPELGVSVRTLRKLEASSGLWDKKLAIRIAACLGCALDDIVFSAAGPRLVPPPAPAVPPVIDNRLCGKQLYPRFARESACLVADAEGFFESAHRADRILVQYQIDVPLHLADYIAELVALARNASRECHPYPCYLEPDDPRVTQIKTRMQWLLIWLKGNDIHVFVCDHTKYLPEMDEVLEDWKYTGHEFQAVIAIAPPQEWGETSVGVDVDHGRPYVIDWDAPLPFAAPAPA